MLKPGPRTPHPPRPEYAGDLIADLKRLVRALEAGKIVLSEVLMGPVGLSWYSVTVEPRLMPGWNAGDPRVAGLVKKRKRL